MLMYLVMQISFLYMNNYLGKLNDVVMSIVQFMLYNCTYVTYRLILVNSTEGGGRLEILVKSLPEICSWKILWSPALVRNMVCFQMDR